MNSLLFVCLFEQMFVAIMQDYKGYGFLNAMNNFFFNTLVILCIYDIIWYSCAEWFSWLLEDQNNSYIHHKIPSKNEV
jgi:hypothetical protein